jgi:hypothetical protein
VVQHASIRVWCADKQPPLGHAPLYIQNRVNKTPSALRCSVCDEQIVMEGICTMTNLLNDVGVVLLRMDAGFNNGIVQILLAERLHFLHHIFASGCLLHNKPSLREGATTQHAFSLVLFHLWTRFFACHWCENV